MAEPHLIKSSFIFFKNLKHLINFFKKNILFFIPWGYVHPTLQVGVSSKLTVSKAGTKNLPKKNACSTFVCSNFASLC
jgi:hypothetical protein